MLVELRLENYAVIDNLAVEFRAGLNLLTGETGRWKIHTHRCARRFCWGKGLHRRDSLGGRAADVSAVFETEGRQEKALPKSWKRTVWTANTIR